MNKHISYKFLYCTREINASNFSLTFERLEIVNKSYQVKNITLPIFMSLLSLAPKVVFTLGKLKLTPVRNIDLFKSTLTFVNRFSFWCFKSTEQTALCNESRHAFVLNYAKTSLQTMSTYTTRPWNTNAKQMIGSDCIHQGTCSTLVPG